MGDPFSSPRDSLSSFLVTSGSSPILLYQPQDRPARLPKRVDLVCFVHLVNLSQPNNPNRPDKQEKPSGSRVSRATVNKRMSLFFTHTIRVPLI